MPPRSVAAVIALLDEGATVPFIARYRKEATGGARGRGDREIEERVDATADSRTQADHPPEHPRAGQADAGIARRHRRGRHAQPSWRTSTFPTGPSAARAPPSRGRRAWSRWPTGCGRNQTRRGHREDIAAEFVECRKGRRDRGRRARGSARHRGRAHRGERAVARDAPRARVVARDGQLARGARQGGDEEQVHRLLRFHRARRAHPVASLSRHSARRERRVSLARHRARWRRGPRAPALPGRLEEAVHLAH